VAYSSTILGIPNISELADRSDTQTEK